MKKRTYRVHLGRNYNCFHSFRDFSELLDAIAYMWAMARANHPERCWLWQGMDGWLTNDHMKNKPLPLNMKEKIQLFITEDNLATAPVEPSTIV